MKAAGIRKLKAQLIRYLRLRALAARIPLVIGRRRTGFHYPESPVKPALPGTARRLLDAERDE